MTTPRYRLLAGLLPLLLAACDEGTTSSPPGPEGFVSADATPGSRSDRFAGAPTEDAADKGGEGETTVEEGDIYRLLPGGRIADLNPYRGLLILDVSDPAAPAVIGRAPLTAWPVEMYVVGDRAYALVNGWRGYWGGRDDVALETYEGGMVVSFDLSDPADPRIVDTAKVPGYIGTSRLVRDGDAAALYVVSSAWSYEAAGDVGVSQASTLVRSFSLGVDGSLSARGEVDLGGWVQAVQGTPQALLVAYQHDGRWNDGSRVKVVRIDAAGVATPGPEVVVHGWVRAKTNLDMSGDVLRVASSDGMHAHLETFLVDGQAAVPADHDVFGDNEDLYASIFMGDRAFFVTYRRMDPFHAFSIDDQGIATEHSAFEVSGWNDFFKPAFDGTRLLGVGVDDAAGWKLAASLWNIEDLDNPEPLVARATVEDSHGWSEARWDDRAFTVLENAVSVQQGDVTETGLILLPYSGYDATLNTYGNGVQLFTFSRSTLTRRGVLPTDVPVRRGISTAEEIAGALTDSDLSMFDVSDPAAPELLGRVELAPNFADFVVSGEVGVRLRSPEQWYGWWGGQAFASPAHLEVIELGGAPDEARPLASFEVPAAARVHRVGELVITVETRYVENSDPARWRSTVDVFDLSGEPRRRGHLVTEDLPASWGGWWYAEDCFDCGRGYYGGGATEAHAVGEALAFPSWEWRQEIVGSERQCYYSSPPCADGQDCEERPVERVCHDVPHYRTWRQLTLSVLDLRDPDAPVVHEPVTLDRDEDADSLLADGAALLESYRVPALIPGDPRPFVRWYVRRLDLSDPANPRIGAGVNVPGAVIAVEGDEYLTRDQTWGETIVETSVARVKVEDGRARLLARQLFPDVYVSDVKLDAAGHVLVGHRVAWESVQGGHDWSQVKQQLTVLSSRTLERLSTTDVDSWATLQAAIAGRALFGVPGGMLVMNLDDPRLPYAQAYFPTMGWPSRIERSGRDVYFAAGRFGIVRFDVDEVNLNLQ